MGITTPEKKKASQDKWRAGKGVAVAEKYKNVQSDKARAWRLRKFGGVYATLSAKQNVVCAICKKLESVKRKKVLSIDHDHKTGKIRVTGAMFL